MRRWVCAVVLASACGTPCEFGELRVSLLGPGERQGTATVVGHEPDALGSGHVLTLEFEDGQTADVPYFVGDVALPVTVGQTVTIDATYIQQGAPESGMVLHDLDGALIAALWDARAPLSAGRVNGILLGSVETGCNATQQTCGHQITLGLQVDFGDGALLVVDAGTEVEASGFRIGNGQSRRYPFGIANCSDIEVERVSGYIIAE